MQYILYYSFLHWYSLKEYTIENVSDNVQENNELI